MGKTTATVGVKLDTGTFKKSLQAVSGGMPKGAGGFGMSGLAGAAGGAAVAGIQTLFGWIRDSFSFLLQASPELEQALNRLKSSIKDLIGPTIDQIVISARKFFDMTKNEIGDLIRDPMSYLEEVASGATIAARRSVGIDDNEARVITDQIGTSVGTAVGKAIGGQQSVGEAAGDALWAIGFQVTKAVVQ